MRAARLSGAESAAHAALALGSHLEAHTAPESRCLKNVDVVKHRPEPREAARFPVPVSRLAFRVDAWRTPTGQDGTAAPAADKATNPLVDAMLSRI